MEGLDEEVVSGGVGERGGVFGDRAACVSACMIVVCVGWRFWRVGGEGGKMGFGGIGQKESYSDVILPAAAAERCA